MGKDLKWKRTKTDKDDNKAFSSHFCFLKTEAIFCCQTKRFVSITWSLESKFSPFLQPWPLCFTPRTRGIQNSPQTKPGLWKLDLSQLSPLMSVVHSAPADLGRCQQRELSTGLKERERGVFLHFMLDPSAEGHQRANASFREMHSSPLGY